MLGGRPGVIRGGNNQARMMKQKAVRTGIPHVPRQKPRPRVLKRQGANDKRRIPGWRTRAPMEVGAAVDGVPIRRMSGG